MNMKQLEFNATMMRVTSTTKNHEKINREFELIEFLSKAH